MGTQTVLVVDDDLGLGLVLVSLLAQSGFDARHVTSAHEALAVLESDGAAVVISDLRMPDVDGMTLLRRVRARWPELPVVMLTAHGSIAMAVEAMKAGAADFLSKPFDREEVLHVCRKALARADYADRQPPKHAADDGTSLVGHSGALAGVKQLIAKAARSAANVLVLGETGTGKELVARAIHEGSGRRSGPFIKLNCAALPDSLLESELFGHEKGAFTGAVARRPGRFELASGGTIFLDEIGDVSAAMQAKLLRVLQEREIERLGGTQTIKVDVRFIAATHRPLEDMVRDKTFREDLYYRLNVVPIQVPPLRARKEDIALLVAFFCARLGASHGRPGVRLSPEAIARLEAEPWPGNIRQLQNLLERLIVLGEGELITDADVAAELGRGLSPEADDPSDEAPSALEAERHNAERAAIKRALDAAGGNRSRAARLLGVSRRTLYNRIERLRLDV